MLSVPLLPQLVASRSRRGRGGALLADARRVVSVENGPISPPAAPSSPPEPPQETRWQRLPHRATREPPRAQRVQLRTVAKAQLHERNTASLDGCAQRRFRITVDKRVARANGQCKRFELGVRHPD